MNPIHALKTLSDEERKSILENDSYSVEEGQYVKPMTNDELRQVKDELTEASVKKAFLDDEFDQIKESFKSKISPLKEQISVSIVALKSNSRTLTGKIFNMADQTERMMYQVDSEGNVLGSRMLRPEERQMVIGRGIGAFNPDQSKAI